MIVHIKKIINEAIKNNYAIGAFDTFNLEITKGIIKGAVESDSPVIIQFTPKTMKYSGTKTLTGIIKNLAESQGKKIPIALHLDHGKSISDIKECIEAGFSSVMIDASNKPFQENIKLTRKVVNLAHKKNVWVQGEIGKVDKGKKGYQKLISRPEDFLTDPDQALEFVKKTKIDTLAVAIGNIHGSYKIKQGVPRLILSRLKEIQKKVDLPMVLHGASGISLIQLRKAIELGIKIINIDTELRIVFKERTEKFLKENKEEYDPRKILSPGIKGVSEVVFKKTKFLSQPK